MAVPSADQTAREPNKLILCFDGTGNAFSGSNADTNVVKILHKLDRHHPKQYHYYQTGVGTYDINERSVHKTWLGEMRSSLSKTVDQAIGTTFDSHVMAGYRFLMRYYEPGDKIYMFGFSRGAFTARFLARMIYEVGLLCKGNEELVPFAYRLYQRYLAAEIAKQNTAAPAQKNAENGSEAQPLLNGQAFNDAEEKLQDVNNEVRAFSSTFCRKEPTVDNPVPNENVKAFFLGMWDCVNSVAVFEGSSLMPVPVKGTATYVRHAVAADERRVKFKPALLDQDDNLTYKNQDDIKEVWFPGCHGDVGGGWPANDNDNVDHKPQLTTWQRFKHFWFTHRPKKSSSDWKTDAFQMSDVALSWMIDELELVEKLEPLSAVKWSENAQDYKELYQAHKTQALRGVIHDSLVFGGYAAFFKVLMWQVMEFLPVISRWELENNHWAKVYCPLNKGSYRDIPRDAVLHESLWRRLKEVKGYAPANNHGGNGKDGTPCLNHETFEGFEYKLDHTKLVEAKAHPGEGHELYAFPGYGNITAPKLTNGRFRN
ncbi:hypothetical protein HJFPF1_13268 [Paramyrothecium foliicola]|nr:hypothetical protein HJFPF1_13268 [Paramyrothecium foliicola]